MSRYAKQIIRATGDNQPPTPQQITQFNLLLRQLEGLAREINTPPSNLLFSSIHALLYYILISEKTRQNLISSVNDISEALPSALCWLLYIAAVPTTIYVYRTLFRKVLDLVTYFFPNGISLSRKKHAAYNRQTHLGSQKKLQDAIIELESHIRKQLARNHGTLITFMLSLLLPLLLAIKITPEEIILTPIELRLMFSVFGASLIIVPKVNYWTPRGELSNFAGSLQALSTLQWVYKYLTWNAPKQMQAFEDALNRFIPPESTKKFIAINNESIEKFTCLLEIKREELIPSFKGNQETISGENYLTELHRILLEYGFLVIRAEDKIYIGYSDNISSNTFSKAKAALQIRLEAFLANKKMQTTNIKTLSCLGKSLRLTWNTQTDFIQRQHFISSWLFRDQGSYVTFYYVNLSQLDQATRNKYKEKLDSILLSGDTNLDGNILTISGNVEFVKNAQRIITDYNETLETQRDNNATEKAKQITNTETTAHAHLETTRRRKVKRATQEQGTSPCPDYSPSPMPTRINFNGGVYYDSKELDQAGKSNKTLPDNFAYPLAMPYIPAGFAFVTVDPNVFKATEGYLTRQEIQRVLLAGSVHGYRQTGSKTGAIGIQIVGQNGNNPPTYTTVNGETKTAAIKWKNTNNIRIFGCRTERTDEGYVLYTLDGPGYGH